MAMSELRIARKLTQDDVANALHVDRSTVAKWETGAAKPRADKLLALAKLLGCTMEELMADGKNDAQSA